MHIPNDDVGGDFFLTNIVGTHDGSRNVISIHKSMNISPHEDLVNYERPMAKRKVIDNIINTKVSREDIHQIRYQSTVTYDDFDSKRIKIRDVPKNASVTLKG